MIASICIAGLYGMSFERILRASEPAVTADGGAAPVR